MKKFYYTALALALPIATVPQNAFAQDFGTVPEDRAIDTGDVDSLLEGIMGWVNVAIPIVIGIGFIIFLFAVIKFILAGGDEESRKEARQLMLYAIIGVFVMVAIWGIIALVAGSFGIGVGGEVQSPDINFGNGNNS